MTCITYFWFFILLYVHEKLFFTRFSLVGLSYDSPKLTYTLLLIFNYTNSTLFYFLFTILPNTCTSYLQCSHQGCNLCSLCRSWTLFRIFKSNARTFMCLTNAMGWAVPRPLVPLTECKCFILLTNISWSKNK